MLMWLCLANSYCSHFFQGSDRAARPSAGGWSMVYRFPDFHCPAPESKPNCRQLLVDTKVNGNEQKTLPHVHLYEDSYQTLRHRTDCRRDGKRQFEQRQKLLALESGGLCGRSGIITSVSCCNRGLFASHQLIFSKGVPQLQKRNLIEKKPMAITR